MNRKTEQTTTEMTKAKYIKAETTSVGQNDHTDVEPSNLRVVSTSATSGWVSLRYTPREVKQDGPSTSE